MGVKKLKASYFDYFITPKTKNKTFVYKSSVDTTFTYIAKISPKYKNPVTYYKQSKNNLIIITKYFNASNGKFKTVKTTFKNYFKSRVENRIIFNNFDNDNTQLEREIQAVYICVNQNWVYPLHSINHVVGTNKNDTHSLNSDLTNYIYDEKGKDRYEILNKISSENYDFIYDFSGNDRYNISQFEKLKLIDYKGKDYYDSGFSNALEITDYFGDDNFNIKNSNGQIEDYKGKDVYTITKSNINVVDYSGNDRYFLKDNIENNTPTDTLAIIKDYKGNDRYELTKFDNLELTDANGKDNYIIKNSKIANIIDNSGKDNYTINNSSNITIKDYISNDTYTVENLSKKIIIDDYSGSNIYSLNNSQDITINDKSTFSNTIYNLRNIIVSSEGIGCIINDFGGNDNYTLTDSKGVIINDYNIGSDNYKITNGSFEINDYGISKDSYDISGATGKISDSVGNDIYNISNLSGKIEIEDSFGYDTINFKDYKQSDLIFMADFDSETSNLTDLIIYDSKNQGYIAIKDYYEYNENGNCTNFSRSQIEKIKIGKDDITSKIISSSNINLIDKSQIVSWLNTSGCDSISEALDSKEFELTELIQIFSQNTH